MKRIYFFILILLPSLVTSSCARKITLQDATRPEDSMIAVEKNDIKVQSFFAGDAIDYLAFELDLFNNSNHDVIIDARDITLIVEEGAFDQPLNVLRKQQLIEELQIRHREIRSERRANNIFNAIGVGINLIAIGSNSRFPVVDGVLYASESAGYMIEENRAYKLFEGSLEDQMEYVNTWVLGRDTIAPGSDHSWDILFERSLFNAPAKLIINVEGTEYLQHYEFYTREERLR